MTYLYSGPTVQLTPQQVKRIRRIVGQVEKRLPIANIERLCFEPMPLDNETFDLLMAALQGRIQQDRKQKMVASWILSKATLTETQRATACTVLGDLVVKKKSKGFSLGVLMPSRESGLVLSVMAALTLAAAFLSPEAAMVFGVTEAYIGIYPCIFLEAKMRRDVAIPAQAAISVMQVRESVDILAGLWMGGYDRVKARASLDTAFAALTDDDYGRMDPATIPRLLLLLEWYTGAVGRKEWNVDRATNILTALGKIGDKRAIPAVRRLINKSNEPMATRNLAVYVVARLEERDRQEQMRSVLLRGSSVTAAEPSLLRASYDTTVSQDPTVLVRPVEIDIQN